MKNLYITLLLLAATCIGTAQTPTQIKDINPAGSGIPFTEKGIIAFGDHLIFAADDGTTGQELWISDGTENGTLLLKDINPGANGSGCDYFFEVNGNVLFTADDGTNGYELWRTDGTEAGTALVKDISTGGGSGISFTSASTYSFYVWNDVLYFSATSGGSAGSELWRSDGTEAGTYLIKDINSIGSSSPEYFAAHDGKLYFAAREIDNGTELWVTDGTEAGTERVADIHPVLSSNPRYLTSCNGYLLFTAEISFDDRELWRSDGTEAGTVMVKDINPAAGGLVVFSNSFEKRLVKAGNVIYFAANDGTNGVELWKSDGTEAGTVMVKDASSLTPGSTPENFAVIGDVVYYSYGDDANGRELWRSDGTEAGTYMVKNITPGVFGSFPLPAYMSAIDDQLFFGAGDDTGSFDVELWKSDGTEAGTEKVADLAPGNFGSSPQSFIQFNDFVVFMAQVNGYELWKYPLGDPLPLSGDIQVTGSIDCFGDETGALQVNVAGGIPPYAYSWDPSNVQGAAPSGLGAGDYDVTVTDDSGTTLTFSATLTEPPLLTATTSSTPETTGMMDGSAEVTAGGGTPPYQYLWNTTPAATTAMIENLAAGDYTVTITDANGCTRVETVTVDLSNDVYEAFETGLYVFPSPAVNQFYIHSQQSVYGMDITLNAPSGKRLKQWKNVQSGQSLEIDGLPDGIYYLVVTTEGRSVVKKVVVAD